MSAGELADGPIVVGTDGSEKGREAVRWAAGLAARRQRRLRIVHAANSLRGFSVDPVFSRDVFERLNAEGKDVLAAAQQEAEATGWPADIEVEMSSGDEISVLIEESRSAAMLVLGAEGVGGFAGMLAGSTAIAVTGHAECPVVVIRHRDDGTPASEDGPVVVGVDGSPVSEEATAVAFHEASLRNVKLVAVNAMLDIEYDSALNQALVYFEGEPKKQHHEMVLAERLAGWTEKYPDVVVERVIERDRPRRQLMEWSDTASLLVVGSRGRGGFRGLLLGSTSQAMIHHARCPVMVVRHERHR
ncbi:universal stress protein [Prauserella alba]|uniref:Universal stress protein n=1 Tax=Prauserella alba TaxID=176898 RepID=A0ABN1VLV8_9PSEU|nr:universal stress protein [Prauserella alba]MCP2180878.1 Nucleotide-binding universal stress protein, UspA family [Prauserella alba]